MLPTFIGIGAPKAATTWMYKCLGEHPEVFIAKIKEINFFAYLDEIDHRIDEYAKHFEEANGQRAVGEISVGYLASPDAPARVRKHLPDAKIFVSLRNPFDQINSHYWHLHRQNFHTWDVNGVPRDLRDAIRRFPELLVEPSRYFTHLQRWYDQFPAEQIHVVLYDDVERDPLSVLQGLFRFIGVDDSFVPPSLIAHGSDVRRGVSPRSKSADRLHANVYHLLNRYIYKRMKSVLGERRASDIKELLRTRQTLEAVFYRPGYQPLSTPDRRLLREVFADEIPALSKLTGLDLRPWLQDTD